MRTKTINFVGLLLLAVSILNLTACDGLSIFDSGLSSENRIQTGVAQTMAVERLVDTMAAGTLAASGKPGQVQVATVTPPPASIDLNAPVATIAPTILSTPIPETPMVSVSRNMNCRAGPGTEFDIIGVLLVGAQAEIVGSFPDWNYWIIKNPDKPGECWLWGEYATVVGETALLPKFTPPPTPIVAINWTGTWSSRQGNMNYYFSEYTLTQTGLTVTGADTGGTLKFSIYGTLSADMLTLNGQIYDNSGVNIGTFSWQLLNNNQFTGYGVTHYSYGWCGYRAGAGFPEP